MNMTDVINLVNTNRGTGNKENLFRMRLLMKKIGDPQLDLNCIHIAGTNGKGSTSAFLASILVESGIKTGVFTSPHLEKVNERIQIDKQNISDADFISVTEQVAPLVEEVEEETGERLYSFEILTAAALLYFAEKDCKLVILEAGIGGRLDATNIIKTPEVAIITSIGFDHMKLLGETKEEIAAEKAGIIKEAGTVICPVISPEINKVIRAIATTQKARLNEISHDDITQMIVTDKDSRFHYKQLTDLTIYLLGAHQVMNASLAIEAALELKERGYDIGLTQIRKGLSKTVWPGRMEKISQQPTVIIDGAHNPEGVAMLKQNVAQLFPTDRLVFVVGMMKDKAYMEMIEMILPLAETVYTVSPDPYRGFDAEATAQLISQQGFQSKAFDSVKAVIGELKNKRHQQDTIIVFGSLYLIGDMKKTW